MRKFRHARRLRGELMSEINITPFVDVLLVLSLTNNSKLWEQKLPVYLQMDEQVPYGILMELMLLFKNAGFQQVGLVFKKDSQ